MASRYLLTPSIKWSSLVLLLVVGLPAAGLAQQRVYKVDAQGVHENGIVIKISKVICEPTHTALQVQIVNSYSDDVSLNYVRSTFLRDAMGTDYPLSPPTNNEDLEVPAGEALEGTLVFLGGIPVDSTEVALIVNAEGFGGSIEFASTPRFNIELPLRAEETEQKKNPLAD